MKAAPYVLILIGGVILAVTWYVSGETDPIPSVRHHNSAPRPIDPSPTTGSYQLRSANPL
jgi:hypothetical protein